MFLQKKDIGIEQGSRKSRTITPQAMRLFVDLLEKDQPQAAETRLEKWLKVTDKTEAPKQRKIFTYEASDMVNLANRIFRFMLTREGKGIQYLDECSMLAILNDWVFERVHLTVSNVRCETTRTSTRR